MRRTDILFQKTQGIGGLKQNLKNFLESQRKSCSLWSDQGVNKASSLIRTFLLGSIDRSLVISGPCSLFILGLLIRMKI